MRKPSFSPWMMLSHRAITCFFFFIYDNNFFVGLKINSCVLKALNHVTECERTASGHSEADAIV